MNKTLTNLIHREPIFSAAAFVADHLQMALLKYYRERTVVEAIEAAYREADLKMRPFDAYSLYELARMQASVPGSMAEIGMYRGGSAKIICQLKGEKKFYGFDTFEGLPDIGRDDKWVRKGEYKASQETVAAYLSEFPGVTLTRGLFPESGGVLRKEQLSFVHLDIDLYKGTIESLNFLWPRMSGRGLILVHDTHFEGVKRAIREFRSAHNSMAFGCGCMQVALIRI